MHWTVHLSGGPRRVNHAAVAVGNFVYSFGGYCTGDNYKDRNILIDVFVLNTETYRWQELQKPSPDDPEWENWPFQRYGHAVAAKGERIYLFGGRNDETACNQTFFFDTRSLKWSKPRTSGVVPAQRDGHTACIIEDGLYVFGGYEESQLHFGLDVFRLDLVTYQWELLSCRGEAPTYRDFHTATTIGRRMYIFGGRSDLVGDLFLEMQAMAAENIAPQLFSVEYYPNELYYLDTDTMTWHKPLILGPRPDGRRSHSSTSINDKLVIFGGYNGKKEQHYNDMWMLDLDTWSWKKLHPHGDGPNARRRQAMCKVGSRVFIFGGTSVYDGPPIQYTPEQLEHMPDHISHINLVDHNDLFVLDLFPSLKTLSTLVVLKHGLNIAELPHHIKVDLDCMTRENTISSPLKTG